MKRSEFSDIVNAVELEERKRLQEILCNPESTSGIEKLAEIIANMAVEISTVAARTTAEILIRSGAIHLDG